LLFPVVGGSEKLDQPVLQVFEMGYRVALMIYYLSLRIAKLFLIVAQFADIFVIQTGKSDIPEFAVSTYTCFDPCIHKGSFFTKLKFSG
jgi:hypothetical protein